MPVIGAMTSANRILLATVGRHDPGDARRRVATPPPSPPAKRAASAWRQSI